MLPNGYKLVWLQVDFVRNTCLCTITISMKIASMTHISFALMGCHSFTLDHPEKM